MFVLQSFFFQNYNNIYYSHSDHLGSNWITVEWREPVQYLQYLPYGELWMDIHTVDPARYTFSGKEKDEETGYHYFGARYYDSNLGIWLSVDPMAAKYPAHSPYVYCLNNPIKLIDPNGMEVEFNSFKDKFNTFLTRIFNKDFRQKYRELKNSNETYVFNQNDRGDNSFTTDGDKLFINYSKTSQTTEEGQTIFSNLRHETTHASQFEHGEIGFEYKDMGWGTVDADGNYYEHRKWSAINYDIMDEYGAHNAQNMGTRMKTDPNSVNNIWNRAEINKEDRIDALRNVNSYKNLPLCPINNSNKDKIKTPMFYILPHKKR